MAGGRNLLKVGQVFQFVGQRFFFKLPTDHFFPITLGHETWWPTFFNCDNIWDDNLQKIDRLTYQLSSGGVGRGKDEGPFFFHHPEKRPIRSEVLILNKNMMTTGRVDWTPWPSTTLSYVCDTQTKISNECLIMIFWLTRTLNQGSRNCGILVSGMGKVEKKRGKARKHLTDNNYNN